MNTILDTGIKLVKNVGSFDFGAGSLSDLQKHIDARRMQADQLKTDKKAVFIIDEFFSQKSSFIEKLGVQSEDKVLFISTQDEPTTDGIDQLLSSLIEAGFSKPAVIVGIGGGTTLDTAKAVANLLTNGGRAEQYQGWDLVKVPAVYKIGIPTISGTGSEATRTCVMTNTKTGLKLGMNSDHTVFNHLILDPELTTTVPRNQYFYTGMDAYIHCIEALAGSYRNAVGDAYSRETINLCRQVFLGTDMMNQKSREDLMVASYLGGCAIATSYVGIVHPFSAGLSVVLKLHHCVANCIALQALGEFYPEARDEFLKMADLQKVTIPTGVCKNLSAEQFQALYDSTIIHQKPLTNALGADYKKILTFEKVVSIFKEM